MSEQRDIPPIPEQVMPADLRKALLRMREELQGLLGLRGSGDRALRLSEAGGAGGSTTIIIPGGSGGGGDTPDLTPPPSPSSLAIAAAITDVIITWDGITYTQGHGNKQTLIYAVKRDASDPTLPTFGDAQLVAAAPQALTIIALPSEPSTRWHVWAKFETNDGVLSVSPAGGTNGVSATTSQDPEWVLDLLTRQITASQLYYDLATPIGSLSILQEQAAEAALANAVAVYNANKQRLTDLLAEAQDRGTAISDTRVLISTGDAQLAQQITTLTAKVDTGDALALAAVADEATARAAADSAEATLRTSLATQMRGAYTGTDINSVTTGLLFSERTARSSADSAASSRLDGLESSVNTPSTGLLARASALESVTTNVTSGNAALATRASSLEASVNTPSTGLLARATALESVTTNATSGNAALATRASGLEATVNNPSTGVGATYARLLTEESARAALDGSVHALYTLRAEVSAGGRTVVGGFGLAATATASAGPRIDFGVRADQFWIAAPAGSGVADVIPFVVRTTTTTEGGVTVPPGVYIDAAYIVNLTAKYAVIQTAVAGTVQATAISAAQLTLGDGTIGGNLKSSNWVSGTSGWRLTPAGAFEANSAVLRGTIYASAGSIGGITIGSSAIYSSNYIAGTSGWRVHSDGSAELNNVTVRGGVYAATGQIGGNNLGADYIQSSNFVAGSTGWRVKSDGTAEFSSITLRNPTIVRSAGPVPFNQTASHSVLTGTAAAALTLMSDGTIRKTIGTTNTTVGNWYLPTTAGIGSSYSVVPTLSGDMVLDASVLNRTVGLNSGVGFGLNKGSPVGEKVTTITASIVENSTGNVVAVGLLNLEAAFDA